jgi:hypothetical protein
MHIDPAISWVIALGIAILFATAVGHKLRDWKGFQATVANYGLLPGAVVPMAAAVVMALECSAVLFILLIETRSLGALLSAGLLGSYALAMAINLVRGRDILDCGCLGISQRQPVRWWMVGRNLAMAALSLIASGPIGVRALTALDAVTIIGATLSLALLYATLNQLGAAAPRLMLR